MYGEVEAAAHISIQVADASPGLRPSRPASQKSLHRKKAIVTCMHMDCAEECTENRGEVREVPYASTLGLPENMTNEV
jgi:hypothetical protein